jgi:hypothetical protein
MLEPVDHPAYAAPQDLCGLLDGHLLEVRNSEWTIRVFSVFETSEGRWAQISLVGRQVYSLLLRIDWSAEIIDVFCALEMWLARPRRDDRVLSIAGVSAAPVAIAEAVRKRTA